MLKETLSFFMANNRLICLSFLCSVISYRGVVRVDVSLQDVDIDQCSADGWFAGTHRCNLTTMEVSPSLKSYFSDRMFSEDVFAYLKHSRSPVHTFSGLKICVYNI